MYTWYVYNGILGTCIYMYIPYIWYIYMYTCMYTCTQNALYMAPRGAIPIPRYLDLSISTPSRPHLDPQNTPDFGPSKTRHLGHFGRFWGISVPLSVPVYVPILSRNVRGSYPTPFRGVPRNGAYSCTYMPKSGIFRGDAVYGLNP